MEDYSIFNDNENEKQNASDAKEELKQIDKRIEELKENIALGEALERLHENEDFKKVILDGYFEKESKRIFGLLTTPTHLKRDIIENLNDKLGAIRIVKQYFGTVLINAQMAPEQIEEEEEYRKEVTASASIIEHKTGDKE